MNTTTEAKPERTTVLYHGNCYDGFGAALAVWMKLGNDADYIPVSYGHPPPDIAEGPVMIVDFSYPADQLWELAKHHEFVVLDHHATAEKDLAGLEIPDCIIKFDMTKSGAVMAWEFMNPGRPVPEFFLYLQDRDLWRFALPESREVSMALRSYPMEFPVWSNLLNAFDGMDSLKAEGKACRRLTEQQVDLMARNHRWVCFDIPQKVVGLWGDQPGLSRPEQGWYWVPCSNATVFFSEVGEKLLELFPSVPFAAYYLDRRDGKRQWGLRSRSDFDCSEVAKAMGGGGHKQAAGFVQDLS